MGVKHKITDDELLKEFQISGSPAEIAKKYGLDATTVYRRRRALEKKLGLSIETKCNDARKHPTFIPNDKRVAKHTVENGLVFIASDAHYWPGETTIAHQAFVKLIKKHKPQTIVMNGDVFDGARTSRHDPTYRHATPSVKQEIEACKEHLWEIQNASKNAVKFWTIGNHDTRLFRYITTSAPEALEVSGIDIFDHFPGWNMCWMIEINESTVIKHRFKGGYHATHNNTLTSGRTIVTGHLHQLKVTPFSDYNGRRWGVDTGTLAEPYGPQFGYVECNPVNWCSGFAVLTYKDGKLLPPELCEVIEGKAYFRGEQIV